MNLNSKSSKQHKLQKWTPFWSIFNSFRGMNNSLNLRFCHVVKITLLNQRWSSRSNDCGRSVEQEPIFVPSGYSELHTASAEGASYAGGGWVDSR